MRIGYSIEGSTDRALIHGLRDRWCHAADLIEGHFRGTTGLARRREINKIFDEFILKGVDVTILMTDGNGRAWQEVQHEEYQRVPAGRAPLTIVGVPDRNVECWICADAYYVANRVAVPPETLRVPDPKHAFEAAMQISRNDRKEAEIAELVRGAPLRGWLASPSFSNFYEQARDMSQRLGCQIENLLEARSARGV